MLGNSLNVPIAQFFSPQRIDFSLDIGRKQSQRHSGIFSPLLGRRQEFLSDTLRRGWPFGHEAKLEVGDNPIDDFMVFYERDDLHMTSPGRAEQRVHFVNLTGHPDPT